VLHATGFRASSKTNLASYMVHYVDGQTAHIPIVYGKQVGDWWFDPSAPAPPTNARVIWTGQNQAAASYRRSIRLYEFTWTNPRKKVVVERMTLASNSSGGGLFVLAVTVDP
jgi:hypothetical protein